MIDIFDPSINFWESNPQLTIIEPFKNLHKSDKSKDKSKSSLMMYFVAYCYDMSPQNKFRNESLEEKHRIIGEDYCEDIDYFKNNKKVLEPIIEKYCHLVDTPALRALRNWNNKIMERDKFISDTPYTMDDAESLDKLMANTAKIYDHYEKVLKMISAESGDSKGKGGYVASLNDEGDI